MVDVLPRNPTTRGARALRGALTCGLMVLAAAVASAEDGQWEISQACAEVGCFPGDSAGFPVNISQSGSYKLTSSLLTGGATGIYLANGTRMVNIDLNGFRIDGGSTGQGRGIQGGGGASSITIRNGTIAFMAGDGIDIGGSAVVESMAILANGGDGVDVNQTSLVRDSRIVGNGGYGINFSDRTSLYSSIVFSSNGSGSVNLGKPGQANVCDDDRCSQSSAVAGAARVWWGSGGRFFGPGFYDNLETVLAPTNLSDQSATVRCLEFNLSGGLLGTTTSTLAPGEEGYCLVSSGGYALLVADRDIVVAGTWIWHDGSNADRGWGGEPQLYPIDCESQRDSYAFACGWQDLLEPAGS